MKERHKAFVYLYDKHRDISSFSLFPLLSIIFVLHNIYTQIQWKGHEKREDFSSNSVSDYSKKQNENQDEMMVTRRLKKKLNISFFGKRCFYS